MAVLSKQIYVNLPVRDVKATMAFFTEIGFEFNMQFTNDDAACLVIGENIFAMLLAESYFKSFTKKEIPDTGTSSEVIVAIAADSREEVDRLADRALAAGAGSSNEPQDHGFMYSRSFLDLDGHMWEVSWMDPGALEG